MGGKPEVDPIESMTQGYKGISTNLEHLHWDSRMRRIPMGIVYLLSILVFTVGFFEPLPTLIVALVFLALFRVIPAQRPSREAVAIVSNAWTPIELPEMHVSNEDGVLHCQGHSGSRYLTGMMLSRAGAVLVGHLGSLLRSIGMHHGFTLVVEMTSENVDCVLDSGVLEDIQEWGLEQFPQSQLEAYFMHRGFLWSTGAVITGHFTSPMDAPAFRSAVLGALPDPNWDTLSASVLARRINRFDLSSTTTFYATGKELAEWVVQLAAELASEVGGNVPGEFLSPVRLSAPDLRIGRLINPETLQLGAPAGLTFEDFLGGVLITGGMIHHRRNALALMVRRLLDGGKRVIYIATDPEARSIASLAPDAICLTLGRNLVLNPIDPETVPMKSYVGQLMNALEIVAATDLRNAIELELALMRAMSNSSATLADVKLDDMLETDIDGGLASAPSPSSASSRKSELGIAAIQKLYKGVGASAFYGTQTISMETLTQQRLSVVIADIDSMEMERFALDLLAIKIAGLKSDRDLVVIFENGHNYVTSFAANRSMEQLRAAWVEVLTKQLLRRGGLVLSIDGPGDVPKRVLGLLSSTLVFRLQSSTDLNAVNDLLGLTIVQHGFYSKSRKSPQESSFVRTMTSDNALLKTRDRVTCFPIKLDPPPEMSLPSTEELETRVASLGIADDHTVSDMADTLLHRVAGADWLHAIEILRLLERYEPLTVGAIQKFLSSLGEEVDVESIISRLERANMILKGHEVHGSVSYINYRLTMKGTLALKQAERKEGGA